MNTEAFTGDPISYLKDNPWIVIILIWTAVWKAIALWKSARNNHLVIFIIFTVLNTVGIGEIIYLIYLYLVAKNKIAPFSEVIKKFKKQP
jgi:hypothetical protein